MRLIDPNEIKFVIAPIAPILIGEQVHFERVAFYQDVRQIRKIDAEPVRHEHWIDNQNSTVSCSGCQTWFHKDDRFSYMDYCPYCGAKMDEEKENNHE